VSLEIILGWLSRRCFAPMPPNKVGADSKRRKAKRYFERASIHELWEFGFRIDASTALTPINLAALLERFFTQRLMQQR
jgi:hypothetical protein